MIYSVFETEFGWCSIVGERGKLIEITPFLSTEETAYSCVVSKYKKAINDPGSFVLEKADIKNYFTGEKIDFEFSLDLSRYTRFQRKVWAITKKIPYGEIRTYSWVSKELNNLKSSRAVGTALAKNPFPLVIPCHRIIKKNGGLGGFSAAGGIGVKASLLKMEGHKFDSKGRLHIFY